MKLTLSEKLRLWYWRTIRGHKEAGTPISFFGANGIEVHNVVLRSDGGTMTVVRNFHAPKDNHVVYTPDSTDPPE